MADEEKELNEELTEQPAAEEAEEITQETVGENTAEDIFSGEPITETTPEETAEKPKKKHKKLKVFLIIIASIVAFALIAALAGNLYINRLLNKNIQRAESYNTSNLGINSGAFNDPEEEDPHEYINIALFGIDSRQDGFKGRSDSIIILTVDKERNKMKMTSLARDSYVPIDGRDKNKLGHAYAYGGPELAVRTINQVYNMDIEDYATVNFFGFEKMIDYLGGVEINVSQKVQTELSYIIDKTGKQTLNGEQALAYARTRHNTGGDLARAGRQREVINAALAKAKANGLSKLPDLIAMGLKNCQTSLTTEEIKELGTWALLNTPSIETYAVPDKDCNPKSGKDCYIGKTWFYIYDLDVATQKIHDFIKEEGTYQGAN